MDSGLLDLNDETEGKNEEIFHSNNCCVNPGDGWDS